MSSEHILKVSDRLTTKDGMRTLIMVGHDLHVDKNGIHYLGEEVIERQHNKVTTGGAIRMLQLMFGATTDLEVTTLNTLMNIGLDGKIDDGEIGINCLFNIGLGGCGSNYADIHTTLDQENTIQQMIPFRIVDDPASLGADKSKYWFKKLLADKNKYAYYLKKFESTPTVHCLFKDGVDDEHDGTALTGNPANYTRTEGIETFVEIVLRLTKEDLREYFELYDNPDYPRFNTMGLCIGKKGTTAAGEPEYKDVYQFSILNFSNEMLHFDKELDIIYRVYLA